jgi:hypothetical protein
MHKMALVAVILALATAGCASNKIYGTVLPMSGGTYKAMITAKEEGPALKAVSLDAKTTCNEAGYTGFVTLDQKSTYIGPKVTAAGSETGTTGVALNVLEKMAQNKSKENYKVELTFRCK